MPKRSMRWKTCKEKLQLNECLERMSTEIINLNRSINKDKQEENPNHDEEDGVALANMLDEIERSHRQAEELGTKIEKMQVSELHFALQCSIKLQRLHQLHQFMRCEVEVTYKCNLVQKKLDKENALDFNDTVEMQKAWRELHKNRLQLSEKTNEIECYAKVGWHSRNPVSYPASASRKQDCQSQFFVSALGVSKLPVFGFGSKSE